MTDTTHAIDLGTLQTDLEMITNFNGEGERGRANTLLQDLQHQVLEARFVERVPPKFQEKRDLIRKQANHIRDTYQKWLEGLAA